MPTEKSKLELKITKLWSIFPQVTEDTTSSCPDKTESKVIL